MQVLLALGMPVLALESRVIITAASLTGRHRDRAIERQRDGKMQRDREIDSQHRITYSKTSSLLLGQVPHRPNPLPTVATSSQ